MKLPDWLKRALSSWRTPAGLGVAAMALNLSAALDRGPFAILSWVFFGVSIMIVVNAGMYAILLRRIFWANQVMERQMAMIDDLMKMNGAEIGQQIGAEIARRIPDAEVRVSIDKPPVRH